MAEAAHKYNALILVDACQFAVHGNIDVQDTDCDFLAFSGHKTYGPTGIGVLYGKYKLLEEMPPYQLGGEMVDTVTYEKQPLMFRRHVLKPEPPLLLKR